MRASIRSANSSAAGRAQAANALNGAGLGPAWGALPRPALLLLAGAAVLVAGVLIGLLFRPAPSPCSDMARERGQVRDFLARGQAPVALGLAESALGQGSPAPCGDARAALATLWYGAGVEHLLTTPAGDDAAASQTAAAWLALEGKAEGLGVPTTERLPAMRVAARAYSTGHWALADAAFRQAWAAGDVGPEAVGLRYAILRNWGRGLAFRDAAGNAHLRAQGVRLLATAQALATAYALANGEACRDLQALGYEDCSSPAPDLLDPVLAAATVKR